MLISFLRTIILYLLLIASIRLMGKRQLGEMEPTELVVTMLVANLAAVPMQESGIPLLAGAVPILVVLAMELLLSVLSYHSIKFRRLVCGKPVILIENGKLIQRNLQKTRVTPDELTEYLRLFFYDVIIGENNITLNFRHDRKLHIYEIISNFHNTDLKLEDIAGELHLSPHQPSRVLYEYFGMSFSDMLTETRLADAKYQIEHTDAALTDIALSAGFQSYNGFWKAFRKKYGVTPNQLRRRKGCES